MRPVEIVYKMRSVEYPVQYISISLKILKSTCKVLNYPYVFSNEMMITSWVALPTMHLLQNYTTYTHTLSILSLPLIQEGKLSVTCEKMCTEYWLTA